MKRSKSRTRVQGPSQPGPAGPGRSALSPYNSPGQRELEEDVGSSPPGQAAFTTSSLAGRPYDLRHAAVSLWLSAGVSPLRVAERAGHSVEVLLRVYAKCLDDGDNIANTRTDY